MNLELSIRHPSKLSMQYENVYVTRFYKKKKQNRKVYWTASRTHKGSFLIHPIDWHFFPNSGSTSVSFVLTSGSRARCFPQGMREKEQFLGSPSAGLCFRYVLLLKQLELLLHFQDVALSVNICSQVLQNSSLSRKRRCLYYSGRHKLVSSKQCDGFTQELKWMSLYHHH